MERGGRRVNACIRSIRAINYNHKLQSQIVSAFSRGMSQFRVRTAERVGEWVEVGVRLRAKTPGNGLLVVRGAREGGGREIKF